MFWVLGVGNLGLPPCNPKDVGSSPTASGSAMAMEARSTQRPLRSLRGRGSGLGFTLRLLGRFAGLLSVFLH